MKVALVYDRVNKFGGAERVLLSLHKAFPEAPLYTLVHNPKKSPWSKVFKVIPTYLNAIPLLKNKHEVLAPIASMAFETFDFSNFDVVITVTSSDAKSIITRPETRHICLCLTPTRYFWSGYDEYQKDRKMRLLPEGLKKYFRSQDLINSQRPDEYIAISNEVKDRISKYYHRDSTVIYPSIDDKFYSKKIVDNKARKFYLIVSRLVPYKKVGLVVKTFNKNGLPLVVVGTGSEEEHLKEIAKSNITFTGSISDEDLIDRYSHAKAVIFPQFEDFGLVPIEAQACGTPVIAFAKGGALETIINHKTGLFFKNQTKKSIQNALNRFRLCKFNPRDCIQNAKNFSEEKFIREIKARVLSKT